MPIVHNQRDMRAAQYFPTEGSRSYVIGPVGPSPSPILTVADVLREAAEESSLLGDDARQSDSYEPLEDEQPQ
jgi:hypothetical protein